MSINSRAEVVWMKSQRKTLWKQRTPESSYAHTKTRWHCQPYKRSHNIYQNNELTDHENEKPIQLVQMNIFQRKTIK